MKVKVLCRNPDNYLRETKKDIHKGNVNCLNDKVEQYSDNVLAWVLQYSKTRGEGFYTNFFVYQSA